MDEPTNDLDMETLELLEERLVDYKGTLLIVSHDRAFLDNVVTSVFVFEGEGVVGEYVGGYSDWMAYNQSLIKEAKAKSPKASPEKATTAPVKKKKLSYKEQKELDELPAIIESLDGKQANMNNQISSATFYQQEQSAVQLVLDDLAKVEADLEQAYQRWDELEALLD